MKPLLLLLCLSSCAPQVFQEDGITFVPVPRVLVENSSYPGAAAVALRPKNGSTEGGKVVWYANDLKPQEIPVWHEIKHFRVDPESPTGFCEHEVDGRTWLHARCQN